MLAFCCVDMYGILFVMYSNSVFAITERSEMVLYDVHIRIRLRMILFRKYKCKWCNKN